MRFPRTLAVLSLVGLMTLGTPSSRAEPLPAGTPLVGEEIRNLLQDRQYAEAVVVIDQTLADGETPDGTAEYLVYLKGRALYLDKKYDEAVAAFDAAVAASPEGAWARRIRFGKALTLARKGDFRSAELIFRAEAEFLLSVDRKQEIADVYLEFADDYFDPAEEDEKPDYAKASEFYTKALEMGPKPEKRVEVELLLARCDQELGQLDEAVTRFEEFIKRHADDASAVEARYRLGQCYLAQGKHREARRAWQDLLAAHPDSSSERIAEAGYHLSRTWQIPQPENDEQLNLGVAALQAFVERFPTHELASKARLDIAQSYMHRGRFEDAAGGLLEFLDDERYTTRDEIPEARNLLGRCYQLQKKFPEALATWREYLTQHPTHQAWSSVQREIIRTEYLMAQEQFEAKKYDEARRLWSEFLVKYPLDERNPQVLYLFGQMFHKQDKWDEAIADWRRLVSKYPNTDWSSLAQLAIAATTERNLGKLPEALEEYKKLTWGNQAPKAAAAIARLTTKTLSVATDRVFRSDETPGIRLVTRNLERVSVRGYTVDLETYFRKMHLARGVENLDVALIDPDISFEFEVPDYVEHEKLQSTVEIPLPAEVTSGVMAVTISSETLEATTLVLQSDLDVIVKSSRDEVFVFAENMLTGKPWANVRLLVSDGGRILAEGATGDDGVFQLRVDDDELGDLKTLRDTNDVRVFAVSAGHTASNVVDLQGVGVAQGLTDRGYIYTDRPAYRAGQAVHVRGLVRRAVDDQYTIDQGKQFDFDVFDGRDRLVRHDQVTLGPFGSFHAHFLLPETAPQGQYRIILRDDEDHTHHGTFVVHEYQLEPVRLEIDTERTVFYRGEDIEGTIRASFYYGAPLVGRTVRYRFGNDPRLHEETTNEDGEITFKLPTREYHETQLLSLTAELPERNVSVASNFYLSSQGFSLGVSTIRPVYTSGETFEVTVTARDAEGEPLARKLTLRVLEQTVVDGKLGERLVEEHELTTEEADGLGRVTISVPDGGRFILRAEGADRFENPISAEHMVRVSDDSDMIRLRILADRHTYKVGDTASVRLHWREEPALALVTFQGARVLDYRLVQLKKGENTLEIPMAPLLAPNFELAVAVMTDPRDSDDKETGPKLRFHHAASPFQVERDLNVAITVERAEEGEGPIRPGEQVKVSVTTTDPQGKPVAAEVSLAMVEQSLLDRFSWSTNPIGDFFRSGHRQSAVRTASSVTFTYRPKTMPIDPELLAEIRRGEIAAEESASSSMGLAGAYLDAMHSVDAYSVPMADNQPYAFGDTEEWASLTRARAELVDRDADGLTGPIDIQTIDDFGSMVITGEAADVRLVRGLIEQIERLSVESQGGQVGYQPVIVHNRRTSGLQRGGEVMLGTRVYPVADLVVPVDDFSLYAGANRHAGRGGRSPAQLGYDVNTNGPVSGGDWYFMDTGGVVQITGYHYRNFRDNPEAVQQRLAELAESGAVLLPGGSHQETGYWNPAIVTDENGKATVTFTVPERSTGWSLLARGVTTDTLAGEATDDLVVKKDLFGQLKLPTAFVDGDQADIGVSIHNDAVSEGQIVVILETTIGGRTVKELQTIDVESKGIHELTFATTLIRPEAKEGDEEDSPTSDINATFRLSVAAGEQSDTVVRVIPLMPYGVPVYATAAGSASSDTTAWVETPKDIPVARPNLRILIGPTVERSLLDIVLGAVSPIQLEALRVTSGLDSATSDLIASLALLDLLSATQQAAGPESQSLDARVHAAVGLLVSSQLDDGGWTWTARGDTANRNGSARAFWALTLARKAGYTVPDGSYDKALAYLRNQVAATANDDYESKSILLFSLASAGQGDFALANRLYRARTGLSSSSLAHLALAFAAMDRKPTAEELLDLLGQRNLDDPTKPIESVARSRPWSDSSAELKALYALALQEVRPGDAAVKETVDWLMSHRTGARWAPDKATGPATAALSQWFAKNRFQGESYELTVFVNDVQAGVLSIDESSTSQTIEVPNKLLTEGKQRINFQIAGRGRYTYQCILGGFVPADKLKSTTNAWEVRRTYEPAPLEMDGEEIPRGFGPVSGSYSSFRNPLTKLPVGRRGLVELNVWRRNVSSNTPEEQLEYLVVTEPIPSGATVIEQSVRGSFERFEIGPSAVTFYIGSRRSIGTIRYELHGYLPGSFRAAPTQVRNAYRPEQLAIGALKSLAVLPIGDDSDDAYRLTPQELYELGKRHFNKENWAESQKHLVDLTDNWKLDANIYEEAIGMLLDAHLETGPPARVVHYFEIVKEKWPGREIPFDKILKVGSAYHEMGEYERSYLIFRATVQSSFRRSSGVAGFLQSQGQFVRSVDVMQRLLGEYPPEAYTAAATYALAQRVYAKASEAADDPLLRKQKINRVTLVRRAWSMLESFLSAYPDDPAADQAAFATANALLELEEFDRAADACDRYAKRYPKSRLLDSYWYIIGYCRFATGKHAQAIEMCRMVSESTRVDPTTGRRTESDNRQQAIYILGQIHHSLGEAADAVREYRRVAEQFPDASEAIEYFLRKEIHIDEVTTVRPGDSAQLELDFRNVAACDVKVYRIDLMKFSLLKRDLGGITQINLAGIRPHHEATVELGDGLDYRDRTHALDLPLEEEGAYLVVCRGEDLHTSGLVLVTPLAVEVREDVASGRVRTTVKDETLDTYLSDVEVRVIGSANSKFISGSTDLRGVFVADGVLGTSTVIAQLQPSRYAFFRGETPLGAVPQPAAAAAQESAVEALPSAPQGKAQLLKGLQYQNQIMQEKQVEELQMMYDSEDAGVAPSEAF